MLFNLLCFLLYSVLIYKTNQIKANLETNQSNQETCNIHKQTPCILNQQIDNILDELHLDFSYLQHWRI